MSKRFKAKFVDLNEKILRKIKIVILFRPFLHVTWRKIARGIIPDVHQVQDLTPTPQIHSPQHPEAHRFTDQTWQVFWAREERHRVLITAKPEVLTDCRLSARAVVMALAQLPVAQRPFHRPRMRVSNSVRYPHSRAVSVFKSSVLLLIKIACNQSFFRDRTSCGWKPLFMKLMKSGLILFHDSARKKKTKPLISYFSR